MDHEGMEILRQPAEDGAVERWHTYLDRTKVSPGLASAESSRDASV